MWPKLARYGTISIWLSVVLIAAASSLEKVTVCEVLANPLKYNGKIILLEGEIFGTDEGGWLTAEDCPTRFITGDHVWPNSVFLQDPTDRHKLHEVDFEYDYTAEKHFFAESDKLEKRYPGRKLQWVYEGLFETRTSWNSALAKDPNGATKYIGFGHLGEAPAQIIVKAIRAVKIAPNPKP